MDFEKIEAMYMKKVEHAYNRLRASPYFANSTDELRKRGDMWPQLLDTVPSLNIPNIKIPRGCWEMAIELGVVCTDKKLSADPNTLYGFWLRDNVQLVTLLVFLLMSAAERSYTEKQVSELRDLWEEVMESQDPEEVEDELEDSKGADAAGATAIQEAFDRYKENSIETQRALELRIKQLERELEKRPVLRAEQTTQEAPKPEEQITRIPLPKDGIILIGGHQRVIAKVRALYPNWLYLDGESATFDVSKTSAQVVFTLPQSASHKTLHRLKAQLPTSVPIIWIDGRSVDTLLDSMEREWTKFRGDVEC